MNLIMEVFFLVKIKKTLCMKTEYHTSNGASESFIVNDGCMFWGGTNFAKEQLAVVVWEIEVVDEYEDIYSDDFNTERIAEYTRLAQQHNVKIDVVRDIFCKGADWGIDLANNIKNDS